MPSVTNILLITTDQHRYDTLGCYGAPVCETPNLDALARAGVKFTRAFTNTAICTPARTSLLTGYAPFRHRMLANPGRNVGYPQEIPDDIPVLPAYLKPAGYACGNIGKWHVGLTRGPAYYGFDGEHYEGWHPPYRHPDYLAYLQENNLPRFSTRDIVRGVFANGRPSNPQMGVHDAPVEATYPYFLAERTIQQLHQYAQRRENTSQPFFLACQFFGPHLPYFLPESVLNRYDPSLVERHPSMDETFAGKPTVQKYYNLHWAFDTYTWTDWQKIVAAYWGYVNLIDQQIGRILTALDQLGLKETTAIFFTADHGGFVGNHRLADKGPAMYDDIYRIPLLISWPGVTKPGTSCDAMVTLMDLMPTFLEIAGVDIPNNLDARSLLPLLKDPATDWSTEIFAEFHGHHFPYPQRMIRTQTHKLVISPADKNELYHLQTDPYELTNLYDHPAYAEIQKDLMTRLYEHLVASGDKFHHWLPTMYSINKSTYANLKDPAQIRG